MEANHQELTESSNSQEEENNEIRILMPLVEENTRKLYHASKIGSIQTLKTLIQEDPDIVTKVVILASANGDTGNTIVDMSLKSRRIEMLQHLISISNIKLEKKSTVDSEAPNVTKRSRKSSIGRTRKAKLRRQESNKKTRGRWQLWKKNLKYKGDWLQEVQGTLMLVATVIATVRFQGAINPPGGVWQQDSVLTNNSSWKHGVDLELAQPGVAIMAYKSFLIFRNYLIANSISFLASVSVILLIVSGFPLKNRIFGGLLTFAMCVAVGFLTFAYINGTAMVSGNETTQSYLLVLLHIWYGMVGVVILCCII